MSFEDAIKYLTNEELFWLSVYTGFNVVWLIVIIVSEASLVNFLNIVIQLVLMHWAERLVVNAVKARSKQC